MCSNMVLETPSRSRQYSIQKANFWSILFYVALIPIYGLPYYALWTDGWGFQQFLQALENSRDNNSAIGGLVLLLIIIGGIVVHELIHGATWAYYARHGWRSIRFGIAWKALTLLPLCRAHVP